jgi:hypothetical protein
VKARKQFFFEKKNQKTFAPGGVWTGIAFDRGRWCRCMGIPVRRPQAQKFLRAFFKKRRLLLRQGAVSVLYAFKRNQRDRS